MIIRLSLCLLLLPSLSWANQTTMRLDFFHTGGKGTEIISVDELVVEPSPWSGHKNHAIDHLNRGKFAFTIRQLSNNKIVFRRTFSSIYGEWETTAEAKKIHRTFHESIRFPRPDGKFELTLFKRNKKFEFQKIWQHTFDPDDILVHQQAKNNSLYINKLIDNGNPAEKVDLLIIGDGFTHKERDKFISKSQTFMDILFDTEPFKSRANDFNVWLVLPESQVSGISRPSAGIYRDSPLSTRYDAFRSKRYVLVFDNKNLRRLAANTPYDAIEVLTNTKTYGGGGIYGTFSTVAADNKRSPYIFVHEFGHHFAGLADEYFTSSVAYLEDVNRVDPYEPNVTSITDSKQLKWRHLLTPGTPIPTPWPKQEYENKSNAYQKKRVEIRNSNQPESVMDQLFDERRDWLKGFFSNVPHNSSVGLFEGANYQSNGYYRSQLNCIMFTRVKDFCQVCRHALEEMIDFYSR